MTDQNHTNDTVPQSGRAVTYARVTPGPQTTMLQPRVAALIAFANAQGYPPDRIAVFEEAKRMIYQRTARRNRRRKKQD